MLPVSVWISPSKLCVFTAAVLTMFKITRVTISQFSSVVGACRFVDQWAWIARGRPCHAEETSSQRDRLGWPRVVFSTVQTWSRAVRTWKSGFFMLAVSTSLLFFVFMSLEVYKKVGLLSLARQWILVRQFPETFGNIEVASNTSVARNCCSSQCFSQRHPRY